MAHPLIRAAIRCECESCGNHKKRCVHFAGRPITGTRHPVVMHRIDGFTICHRCLNRRLEIQRRRLYPEIIPDVR